MSEAGFKRLLGRARKTNQDRDKIDHDNGSGTPADFGPAEVIRTALAAIKAGILTDNKDCLAEAYAMLETLLEGGQ